MIGDKLKDKIKLFMNVQEFMCDKRLPTDDAWEKYFINTYNDATAIRFFESDFISYEVLWNCVMIKDFISIGGNGLKLFLKVINVARERDLPIMAFVHLSNTRLLNVMEKRFKFKKVNQVGNQYLLIREV